MKKILFLFFLIAFNVTVKAQNAYYTVSGKVLNAETGQPMQAASVFAENTTLGTATDADGNFKLYLPNGGYDLVVTFTGFTTTSKRITTADASENIVLSIKPKEKELVDVVVKASYEVKDGWEKYGDFFLENFLGKTANGKQCVIKNKEALKFYYYKRSNRLKILATAPVEIDNPALGYTIQYALDSFTHEYNTQVSLYSGSPLFKEMQTDDATLKATWAKNRLEAYNGSILHFMRSLYRKQLKEEGFEIQFLVKFNETEKAVQLKDFYGGMNYEKDDSTLTVDVMPNQQEVAILYKNEKPSALYLDANAGAAKDFQLSVLSFVPKESIVIEQNGYYYEQSDITITNYWAWEKVGDMLPYDFSPQ